MEIEELKELVIAAIEDVKGTDIRLLDVKGKTSVTDIMLIVSGNSSRQVNAIAGNIIEKAKAAGHMPIGVEGEQYGEWVLVDLGDMIVHVMQPSIRDFYNLEKLWGEDSPAAAEGS
ncbi:MAG: ribosome silencing factor [Gammaproteobacteria bacterium]|nr:ribosome silencing factor [Gammaproteobacteria bacterium]